MFYCRCFFSAFFHREISELPRPRRETLPHNRKYVQFCNPGPKIWGLPPKKKIRGPKTCKIRVDFAQLQTLIANISGTDRDITNWKSNILTAIPYAFDGRKMRQTMLQAQRRWRCEFRPTRINFFERPYFGP